MREADSSWAAAGRRAPPWACVWALWPWLWIATPAGLARAEAACEEAPEDPGPPGLPQTASCADAGREGTVAVAFLWTAPHLALERPLSRAFRYAPYPYADGEAGLLRFGEPVPPLHNPRAAFVARCSAASSGADPCAARRSARQRGELSLGAGILTDHRASAYLAARLRTRVRLEPAVELLGTLDWRAAGRPLGMLGHYALDYRFAQSQTLSLRSGLAALTQSDATGTRAGGALSYALEWFGRKPFTLEAQVALGGLAGAFYGRLRLTAGVVWRRLELRLGYDHISLRGAQVTRLSGPRLSLRTWL